MLLGRKSPLTPNKSVAFVHERHDSIFMYTSPIHAGAGPCYYGMVHWAGKYFRQATESVYVSDDPRLIESTQEKGMCRHVGGLTARGGWAETCMNEDLGRRERVGCLVLLGLGFLYVALAVIYKSLTSWAHC